jgi:hypothetical protein
MPTLKRVLAMAISRTAVLDVAIGLAAVVLASPASAGGSIPVSVVCTQKGQFCDKNFSMPIKVQGGGELIQFIASPEHCSNINVFMTLDNVILWKGRLTPGEAGSQVTVLRNPDQGKDRLLKLTASGEKGGCNVGKLGGWKGTLHFEQIF